MLQAQRAHTRATPKARAMCRGNSVPAPRASTPPSRSNKVVSQVYQAAAALNGTEAHPWEESRWQKRKSSELSTLVVSVEYLTYTLNALMPVIPCTVSNMSKRAFDACCRNWHIHWTPHDRNTMQPAFHSSLTNTCRTQ